MLSSLRHAAVAATMCLCASHVLAAPVDPATQQRVIHGLTEKISAHYVFPDQAGKIGAVLRQRLERGDYSRFADAGDFADKLSQDLEEITGDSHFGVYYMPDPVGPDLPAPYVPQVNPEKIDAMIASRGRALSDAAKENFGFEKSERLPANIAYLKISSLYDPLLSAPSVAAHMSRVADAAALVIDLRGNGGGSPKAVALVSAYLFDDKPVHLNDSVTRGWNRVESNWTNPVPSDHQFGSKKPVFILIDKETFSAAENLAYTLQALKRATILGEKSKGGAHGARGFKLDVHFLAMIPNRTTINPLTRADWEKNGVVPDIAVSSDKALERALELATATTRNKPAH